MPKLTLVMVFLAVNSFASAQDKIATVVEFNPPLEFVAAAGADARVAAWSREFRGLPDSPWIIVHFQKFVAPANPTKTLAGGRVEFWNANGQITAPYDGPGPERLLTADGFWSDTFVGNSLVVAGYGDPNQPIHVVIDRFAYADPPEPTQRADAPCIFDLECLDAEHEGRHYARAVARLRLEFNSTMIKATGFLFRLPTEANPPRNRILSVEHAFPFSTLPRSINVEFDAVRAGCADPPGNEPCTGTSFAGRLNTVRFHYQCDIACFETNGTPGAGIPLLLLANTEELAYRDPLFMPQHPRGRCKEYSEGTMANSANLCEFKHYCCGESGSSGSPILSPNDYSRCYGIYVADLGRIYRGLACKAARDPGPSGPQESTRRQGLLCKIRRTSRTDW